MTKIIVLADDLTGTLDCAVQFSKHNIEVSVCSYDRVSTSMFKNGSAVLVVNTDSRHSSPKEAGERVGRVAGLAADAGVGFYYKKIDSLLRGNIGAECRALVESVGGSRLYMLPAFPDNGRYTRGGCQYYKDKPVTESVLGRDMFSRQLSSCVPELLRLQGFEVSTRTVGVSEAFPSGDTGETAVYIFDCETNEDLRRRAEQLRRTDLPWIAAGCAGFAEYIPEALELESGAARQIAPVSKALVVSGSINPVSVEQIRYIEEKGSTVIYLSYEQINSRPELLRITVERAREMLANGNVVIVATTGDSAGADIMKEKSAMCRIIARAAAGIIEGMKDCALVVFGGDTSMGIIEELHAGGIKPVREIVPGVVCSTLVLDDGSENVLITKSGAFGGKDVISMIMGFLRLK